MPGKPYYHELPQEVIDELIQQKTPWRTILDTYQQPEWCDYPQALAGAMGCWSLTDNRPGGTRTRISPDFCTTCDQCKHHVADDNDE